MSYIGNEPIVSATRTVTEVTATAGQTVFNANGGYTVGYLDVFLNGSKLTTTDFTATNGSSISLTEAAQVGDIVRLEALGTFLTSGALTSNNPSYTGTLTGGTGVVNIGSGQVYKDASGNVGIGTSSPNSYSGFGALTINGSSGAVVDFSVGGTRAGTMYTTASGVILGSLTAVPVQFVSNNAERMRIDTSGNLQLGGTSVSSSRAVVIRDNPSAFNIATLELLSNAGDVVLGFHAAGATAVCLDHIRGGGSVRCVNLSRTAFAPLEASAFTVGSDYRLKENIAPIENATARVMQLPVYRFNFKPESEVGMDYGDKTVDGFLAHEVAEVVPEAAFGEKDKVNEDGKPVYQSIDQSKLVPVLWAAIQEQQALIQSQADTITAMEVRLTALENK